MFKMSFADGSSVPEAVVSSAQFHHFVRKLVAAVPDLLDAYVEVQKSGFANITKTAASGGRVCVNFTLTDLLPEAFSSKTHLKALSAAICDLVRSPDALTSELSAEFAPIIRVSSPFRRFART